ncbi:DUF86 domain-containing protein [Galbibacter sp. BG1]|uniref:HepT-like ribonuclease domain-containing protein n=1 Tax=Galbibacter sp. BG1 TaxID=1170699 RepID=UPI0015BD62E8|nr:HepT-like ribonuclease domain-containing protein [Galbibacter sp. BG1]QLE01291.1 DUF86 domain-containing protein [Galbibacter sp. BG1]
MEIEVRTRLEDIKQAINEIYSFLPKEKEYAVFQEDLKGKRAIERNIEIIGEAINKILKIHPEFPITNARKIVDTRNRISQGYDTVSDAIIWTIVVRDLEKLKSEIEKLLTDS